jgi:hypothetical protein
VIDVDDGVDDDDDDGDDADVDEEEVDGPAEEDSAADTD